MIVPPSCHGNSTFREQMPTHAALTSRLTTPYLYTGHMESLSTTCFWLQYELRNGSFCPHPIRSTNPRAFGSRDLTCFKRKTSRIAKNSISRSQWKSQAPYELNFLKTSSNFRCNDNAEHGIEINTHADKVKISSAFEEHGGVVYYDSRAGFEDFSYPIEASDGSSGGGGGNWGGSRWHWCFGGGGNGDDDEEWFSQLFGGVHTHLLLFVGLFFRHTKFAGIIALIPVLLVHAFLHKALIASADGIISPAKKPLDTAINGSELCGEQTEKSQSHDAKTELDAVFEERGGVWRRLLIDTDKDEFVSDPVKESNKEAFATEDHAQNISKKSLQSFSFERFAKGCADLVRSLMLPDGYPSSVTGDYLGYTLWRMGQNIASQINGVLTTQALLYAVGLGKGAIPTAAAVNWVLKDGIGYLSKIMLAKYGRHFDVHPKGWRLLADLIENSSYALELLTPIYPHLFVYLGAAAGAGRSASGLIQAATRSCFYAGFAAQRNFAEVIAKGEAQGMVSKSIGIALGIALSTYVGASGPALVTAFLTISGIHMYCNLRSYQAVQLRTLNPYRASLVFGEFIRRGAVASVEEVNAEEPIFTGIPLLLFRPKEHKDHTNSLLSLQTKEDAAIISTKLKLGVSFSNVIRSQREADELFKIYKDEQYVLAERQNTYLAILKEGASSHDLLKLMLQVCYLYQLENGPWRALAEGKLDVQAASPVEISYRLTVQNFDVLQRELASAGWTTSDGLVSRPLPYRLLETPYSKEVKD